MNLYRDASREQCHHHDEKPLFWRRCCYYLFLDSNTIVSVNIHNQLNHHDGSGGSSSRSRRSLAVDSAYRGRSCSREGAFAKRTGQTAYQPTIHDRVESVASKTVRTSSASSLLIAWPLEKPPSWTAFSTKRRPRRKCSSWRGRRFCRTTRQHLPKLRMELRRRRFVTFSFISCAVQNPDETNDPVDGGRMASGRLRPWAEYRCPTGRVRGC